MWNMGSGASTVSASEKHIESAMNRPRRRKYSWVCSQNLGTPVVPDVCIQPATSKRSRPSPGRIGQPVESGRGRGWQHAPVGGGQHAPVEPAGVEVRGGAGGHRRRRLPS